jgi:hypothetical protein
MEVGVMLSTLEGLRSRRSHVRTSEDAL